MMVNTGKLKTESGNHSTEPFMSLLGYAREVRVVVEGTEITALVDTGSQITAFTKGFCIERGLKILPLRNLMKGMSHLKGMGALQYYTRVM